MAFVHLHVHSQFTLLNGVNTPRELAAAAAGMGALALTDSGNLYGAVDFFKSCKAEKIAPILGAELWVDERGIAAREGALNQAFSVVILVEDEVGYRNLCHLVTAGIFEGLYYRPRVDWERLEAHAAGLTCLTGGELGAIRRLDGEARAADNRRRTARLAAIFGDSRIYAELCDHGLEWQPAHLAEVRAVAREVGIATVATNAVRYVERREAVTLDVLNCIASGSSLNDPTRARPSTDQLYLKSEAEMREIFADDPASVDRAALVADRAHYKFPSGIYYFPSSTPPEKDRDSAANWDFFYGAFPPPVSYGLATRPARPEGGGTLDGYFRWYARMGLEGRLERVESSRHAAYRRRLEDELGMIVKMGFAAYLLIVAEFINWAKDREIPVGPGRGSAAGSIAAWAMRITDIDPMRFDLLFERFLNPERVSMPDIDVDFEQGRRELVIAHVREKYTPPLVSQIITYGKLQAKAALKDVARVCDLTFQESDRLTKLVPTRLNITLDDALKEEPRLAALVASDPKIRRVFSFAKSLEGITRQTGVHAAGVVIADRPLVELAPLYRDGPDGGPVVQYDMKSAEGIGLIKFDFLGLKTLDLVRDTVAMVARNTGESIDIGQLPWEDPAAWKLLQRGDALGVFQVESSGMRELLIKMRPSNLDDLVALVALYRPGPLSSGMVDDFIARKHGEKRVEYPFAELEPILQSTYGTIVYQEQVMQVAQVLAGYSLGEADLLRRAMGKKDMAEMGRQKSRFVDGAVGRGHDGQKASDLFDLLARFAEYGFNKSHSAAYGLISYQTAWLKANHRAEYTAALLTSDADNSDKVIVYLSDARRAGIKVLPPDVNASLGPFDVPAHDRRVIRFGLAAIKGLGQAAVDNILKARKDGPFRDFMDLLDRIDLHRLNKRALEMMIKAGACDSLGEPRARLLKGLEEAMAAAGRAQEERDAGQVSLFGGAGAPRPKFRLPEAAEWPIGERMKFEKEALGFFFSGHPIQAFAAEIERLGLTPIGALQQVETGKPVKVAGAIASKRVVKTKSGDNMCFVTLEDLDGTMDCVFFSKTWKEAQAVVETGRPILVRGDFERREKGPSIQARSVSLMDEVRESATSTVEVRLRLEDLRDETWPALEALFADNRGSCTTRVVLEEGGFRAVVRSGMGCRVRASARLVEGLRGLFGRQDAVVLS
jgi:DNA polymerase-3 subunit alpha